MNIVLWIIQGLLAVLFLMAGGMKTFQTAKAKEQLPWARNRSDAFVRFVGISELLGSTGADPAAGHRRHALAHAACGNRAGIDSDTRNFHRAFTKERI